MHNVKSPYHWGPLPVLTALFLGLAPLAACTGQIDRHGHVFIDVDLDQIQPGMSKGDVQKVLGSPDTRSTIGGDAFYYISTTTETVAFLKPKEIDREVVAVYFDGTETVRKVARYGQQDGIVVDYNKDETPARGKDLNLIEQIFGNISNRQLFNDNSNQQGRSGIPGI